MTKSLPGAVIRVLIADDHAVAREGLAAMLARQKDLCVVGEAADGLEAVERYDELKPDVVLMDLRMPRADGFQALAELMTRTPPPKVVVVTTYDGDEDVRRALKAGARGYLLKDAGRQEVWDTVRRVHAGQSVLGDGVASRVTEALTKPALTEREQEVLERMAKGLSNKEIGAALHISEGTAKTHVNAVLAKLGAASRTEAVVVAARRGLVRLD